MNKRPIGTDLLACTTELQCRGEISFLVFILVIIIITAAALALLRVLPLHTASPATAEGRLEGEVNVLLGVQTNNEGGYVHNLLPNSDVLLPDEKPGVVD